MIENTEVVAQNGQSIEIGNAWPTKENKVIKKI